ncbi:ABC transporter-like protein [Plenodomus tracheiphilus IPT5]|uniref:ABC transporter-like protein n=1 Tax=Plenodomus tracheiphilus IPT5 TaxID=1408161 RepID=A0A6A7BDF9_9PLEO|nr:ABC transporter-like protein [Plenodomus tracheiphilus IPT5]
MPIMGKEAVVDMAAPINPFLDTGNPQVDPNSPQFKQKEWLRAVMSIKSRDPDRFPERLAGVAYQDLSVDGFREHTDYQRTFGNYPLALLSTAKKLLGKVRNIQVHILKDFEGLVKSGEMLLVLGRPGSGCSTLLKTLAGETEGLQLSKQFYINYQGTPRDIMHTNFRGECIYQAELDQHFPQLTVGQTLEFAARATTPRIRLPGVSRDIYAMHLRDVAMATFGLSSTVNTMVGNDFIRGISGGEKKRVSIAEAAIAGSPLQCWDNSTRGLDSATALECIRTLRTSTDLTGASAVVTLYQASQSIYEVFDKVAVLYEGRQIYFGDISRAKAFFTKLGFECAPRQTTGDFLTSLTNPAERSIREGFEGKTPRTPDEFAAVWHGSEERATLLQEVADFDAQYPLGGLSFDRFKLSRRAFQADAQRASSAYNLSLLMQIRLCMRRGYQRLRGDMANTVTGILFNAIMALVIGSVFYNLPDDTGSLYSRGALLFFAVLLAALASVMEIFTLYAQRPIVEKQARYAFYHPFAEGISSMICDLPNKIGTSIVFNLVLYFMTNLRRTPGNFFIFLLFTFACTLTMSMYIRSIAALSRTFPQAMVPTSIFTLAFIIYTGFTIPVKDMHPWFRWINYLNPAAYTFESLMINEFHGRIIPCLDYVPRGPNYNQAQPSERVCTTTGSRAGESFVDGDTYLDVNFDYTAGHLWRNLGVIIALMVFGCGVYLLASEYISEERSKGEVLIFRRTWKAVARSSMDEESTGTDTRLDTTSSPCRATALQTPAHIQKQTSLFHWDSVCYDIKIKKEERRLLDHVDGWVRPGTLTALMGVTGAGKTTLLDVLADRVTMGVISGEMLVNGHPRDIGFQRKTGYVQQQDLHLATATVREALVFSAVLRQTAATPYEEKVAYVDEVIEVLEMGPYSDAIIGVPGEGLNVDQRKRLTIAVELVAKPALLLFLDEPTSGLDSQGAWSICTLLRRLADHGQAVLCTIHQPSATLFQQFDRLLLLAKGGKTIYFGPTGESYSAFTDYFERNGARSCGGDENPAEWMLEITGAAPGSQCTQDWSVIWNHSDERKAVKSELAQMKEKSFLQPLKSDDLDALRPFAASFSSQLRVVLPRVFQQYWRTPSYLYPKVGLSLLSGLFIGFSFWKTPNSIQGLQNQLYAIFMLMSIFTTFCNQIVPNFLAQRALYEVREQRSKTFSWQIFVLSNILVELPWNALMALLVFVSWYYPIGLHQNAVVADQVSERGALMFLFILAFMIFAGTFTHMIIAGVETGEATGAIINLLFSLSLIFCGVLATPEVLPGFWIFMYRVSPLTYFVSGILSVGLANAPITCAPEELLQFAPPAMTDCLVYLTEYMEEHGGYLLPESMNSTTSCVFCSGSDTNVFLKGVSSEYQDRWRNFGIVWAFVVFNIAATMGLYWLARVPKGRKARQESS